MNKQNVIINVDNIQNIDDTSLTHLIKWISNFKNNSHYYLFEYTISDNYTYSSLQQFQNYLSDSDVASDVFLLEKMKYEYIIDVVSRHTDIPVENRHFTVDLTDYYKNDNTGNLRKAIDYSINYSSVENTENTNPTLSNLIHLSSDAKYILSVIIMNNGRILVEKLCDIVAERFISENNLSILLQELCSHLLVSINNNLVELKHASISDSWNSAPDFEHYIQASYHDYEKYLLNELKINNDSDSWIYLLQLYSSYNPSKIKDLLDYLNNGMIDSISPQSAWHYMNMLVQETCSSIIEFKSMYFEIIKICFECELYQEGYNCIQLLEKQIPLIKDHNLLLNKCMYLSALDLHDDNIEICEKYMKKIDKESRTYLNLCLIVMSSYRSTNKKDQCYQLFKEIENNKIYKSYIEYGYFLRLTCMYLPRKEGVKYLKKSINFFRRHGNYHQVGKSLISYAYALASLKKFNKALRSIKEAEKHLKNKRMGQHMFLVNKASILLSKNIFNDLTWDYLDKAELSATVPFDKIAIILNKIIWCIENENYSPINLLINKANSLLDNEPDKHIHALINYDIYLYYKKIGNESKAMIYYNKAFNVRDWCSPMKDVMEGKKNRRPHEWYNCFLEYWTYDLFKI